MINKAASPPRLLAALMVTGAVVLGLKAVAFAEAETHAAAPEAPKTAPATAASPSASTPEKANACAPSLAEMAGLSTSEVQILQSLGARRQALDQRAADLDTREEMIAAATQRVEERVAELQKLEAHVQQLLGQVDDQEEKRIAGLVDVYQRMRAKDAAAVFDALDDDVLVQVAQRMKQQSLAEIMGKMTPVRATHLTQLLAKRAEIDTSAPAAKPS